MTKDLAICIHGNKADKSTYVYTEDFIDHVAKNLHNKLWFIYKNI